MSAEWLIFGKLKQVKVSQFVRFISHNAADLKYRLVKVCLSVVDDFHKKFSSVKVLGNDSKKKSPPQIVTG